jgi:hypothetical protein
VTEIDLAVVERNSVDLLLQLCAMPSVSAEGSALAETADLVESLLAGAGFTTRQVRGEAERPAV